MDYNNIVTDTVEEAAELITKGVTTSDLSANPSGGAFLRAPQNLSPLVINLGERVPALYRDLKKVKGYGKATQFNLIESVFGSSEDWTPNESFYAENGTPPERKPQFKNLVQPYKAFGFKGQTSGHAFREQNGGTPSNIEATNVENTMHQVTQAAGWLTYWSRSDVNNNAGLPGFTGFDQMITTNVIDALGAPISKSLIDRAFRAIAYNGGAAAGRFGMYASYGVAMDTNNLYNTQQQVIVNTSSDRTGLVFGNKISTIRTFLGDVPVNGDYFVNPGTKYPQGQPYSASSGAKGLNVSTIFIMALDHIAFEELLPVSKIDLAITGDALPYMVITHGAPTLRAEPWCAKIINVSETVSNA